MPVRIGKPSGLSGLVDEISDPSYATTVGLVTYAARDYEEAMIGYGMMPSMPFGNVGVQEVVGKVIDVIKSFIP